MKKILKKIFITASILLLVNEGFAQCLSYTVNLSGAPDSTWRSSLISRNGQCCGAAANEECISFNITLDSNTVGVWFYMTGAPALGSEYYKVSCGTQYSMRDTICLSGAGPHEITFCKPGNNPNEYIIEAIAKPTFPESDSTRVGCFKVLDIYGVVDSTVNWSSIAPGAPGAYDSLLSCTNCTTAVFTPDASTPTYVDYEVCGDPVATMCGYTLRACDTIRVYTYPAISGSVTPNPVSFCNVGPGSGVTLTGSGSGGNTNYWYNWLDTSGAVLGTGTTYFADSQQVYTLEVGDDLSGSTCPNYYVSVPVVAGAIPTVDAGEDQVVCANIPTAYLDGSVQDASGGIWTGGNGVFNPGRSYLNASYTPTSAEIASGSVSLVLNSTGAGGGCTNQKDTVVITYPDTVSVMISSGSLLCNNSTAVISSTVTGGLTPYTYAWNNGATSSSITVGEGTYYVIITDSIGCHDTANVSNVAPSALAGITTSTNVSTDGGSDGAASISMSGGVSPYTYSWSSAPAQTTAAATGLKYGVYTVTVTDSNGCTYEGSVVVNEPRCLGFDISVDSYTVNCFGDNSGILTSTVTGGTAPYSYSWNTFPTQTTSSAGSLMAGSYLLTVTEDSSCVRVAYGVVVEPTALSNSMTHVDATTVGGSDGSATANPLGGTSGYSYLWNTSATTKTISSLLAGTYDVEITDSKDCKIQDTVIITEPPCNELVIGMNKVNVSCYGTHTGSATAYVLHGTPPYDFLWSTGDVGSSVYDLPAGNYWVKVTDGIMCEQTIFFSITQPSQLSVALAPTNISCNGSADGSLELNVSGGTFPYSYSWSNGVSSEDQHNLGVGSYSVMVSDDKGCSAQRQASITQPDVLSRTHSVTHVSCFGATTGAIDLNVTGGTSPILYNWSTGASTQDISSLGAGYYVVSVSDANGCTMSPKSIEVTEPDSLQVDSSLVSCSVPGSSTSFVQFYASGGVSPYRYSLNGGSTYQTAGVSGFDLPLDSSYSILLKDSNNCVLPASYALGIDSAVGALSISYPQCNYPPTDTVAVTVTPSGGDSGPYFVSVDGGSNFDTAGVYTFSLATGSSYSIVVKDGKGCSSVTDSIYIPAAFSGSVQATSSYNGYNVSCFGKSDGTIGLSVSGGSNPFTYSWSNGSTMQNLTGMSAGSYSVIVTDMFGCSVTDSLTLIQPDSFVTTITVDSNVRCYGGNNGGLTAVVLGGSLPYQYSWSTTSTTESITGLTAGQYQVIVTDNNGCSSSANETVTQPAALTIMTSVNDATCNGTSTGSINALISGGVSPYMYMWSNGSTTEDLDSIPAGTYSLLVTDTNGCMSTYSVEVDEDPMLDVGSSQGNVKCYNGSSGFIDLTVSGGSSPYQYTWTNGTTTADQNSLSKGSYTVTVIDSHGCSTTSTYSLTEPDSLYASVVVPEYANGHNVTLNGAMDGSIDLSVFGGTPPYYTSWSNGESSEDLDNIGAGNYTCLIVDDNGCTYSIAAKLTEPFILEMPTGYSPNADGKNDNFVVHGIESYPDNVIEVYNRWGNIVYSKSNYLNEWNGYNNSGEELPDATYFVVLNINNGEIVLKGYVDMRRK